MDGSMRVCMCVHCLQSEQMNFEELDTMHCRTAARESADPSSDGDEVMHAPAPFCESVSYLFDGNLAAQFRLRYMDDDDDDDDERT
eukprot:3419191-Amphidinium_carterae.1